MIEEVRDYFLSCPAIKRRAKIFGINNLGPDALDYTVESVPGNPIVKRYTNGAAIPGWVKASTYTVSQMATGRVLLKEIVSWVPIDGVEVV